MSEWSSVIAVFWGLWAIDGARVGPRRSFTLVGEARARRGRLLFSRLSLPGMSPASWRMTTADVPLSLSPAGVCNVPVGSMGRPAESPLRAQAWRWEDVRQVGVANGWIFVNGARFCPDSGHLRAPELLALARLEAGAREKKIHASLRRWFRPAHLQRRARVLCGRSRWAVVFNTLALVLIAALCGYVLGEFSEKLPSRISHAIAGALPWVVGTVFLLHVVAVVVAWRAIRRLRAIAPEKRGAAIFSALLLPPQALRLRTLLGEGFFPAQHPLAVAAAFARERAFATAAFHTLADARWPIAVCDEDAPLPREITGWFRAALGPHLARMLARRNVAAADLLRAPAPDQPASCRYCPRCRDQFVTGREVCPHGVALLPLRGGADAVGSGRVD